MPYKRTPNSMKSSEFRETMLNICVMRPQVKDKLNCSSKTLQRYYTDGHYVPQTAIETIFYNKGLIKDVNWSGWVFRDGKLHSPFGHSYWPSEITNVQLYRQTIDEISCTNKRLELFIEDKLAQLPPINHSVLSLNHDR